MDNLNLWNYVLKVCIIVLFIYLYYIGSITINRIIMFIVVLCVIVGYSWLAGCIVDLFRNKKIKSYVQDNNKLFFKLISMGA